MKRPVISVVQIPAELGRKLGLPTFEDRVREVLTKKRPHALADDRNRLMTKQEVARYFGVSTKTVERWKGSGWLVPRPGLDRLVRYRVEEVERLRVERERMAADKPKPTRGRIAPRVTCSDRPERKEG